MKKAAELVLCYHFEDSGKLEKVRSVLRKLNIECRVLPEESWREKVGFLLGMGGFAPASSKAEEEEFLFPDEVMVLGHIKGKRLDQVLGALKESGAAPIRYKAVATPYNLHWTLRRLCETMKKEHEYMTEGAKQDDGKA